MVVNPAVCDNSHKRAAASKQPSCAVVVLVGHHAHCTPPCTWRVLHAGRWCVPSMWGCGTQPNRRMQMAGAELSVTMQSCQCGCGRQGHGEGSAPMHGFNGVPMHSLEAAQPSMHPRALKLNALWDKQRGMPRKQFEHCQANLHAIGRAGRRGVFAATSDKSPHPC
jgi:hypothetical protein